MAVTTAAVLAGTALAGTVASVAQARKSGKAAERAGELQFEGTQAGIEEQRRQFDITQGNLQPRIEAGNLALEQQQALIGLSGQEAQQQAFAGLEESPGQQFLRRRQERTLLRNSGAIGGLGGGNVRTALQEQAVGFAQQDIQNQFGRLGQIAGQGQTAATNVGQFGQTTAGNVANLTVAGSEARASGLLGKQQTRTQGINQILRTAGQFAGGLAPPPPPPGFGPADLRTGGFGS